ncbi:MAG: hypothetical protein KTR21_17635 [Rhodobacteraceae bacterium]|nr:hypothetical protein [Paracoccaceae bacterium]
MALFWYSIAADLGRPAAVAARRVVEARLPLATRQKVIRDGAAWFAARRGKTPK